MILYHSSISTCKTAMLALSPGYYPRNFNEPFPRDDPGLKTPSPHMQFEAPPTSLSSLREKMIRQKPALPKLDTRSSATQLQIPNKHPILLSAQNGDELFFNCPRSSPNIQLTLDEAGESSSTPYVLFEPVVESFSEQEPTDWRRYDPPNELLQFQGSPSETRYDEIKRVVSGSIARIRARHLEVENRRRAAARPERPLSRSEKVSVKPRRGVSQLKSQFGEEC